MVDLKDLRENPQKYRRGAELKGVKVDFDGLLRADEQRLTAQKEFERLRSEQNDSSKQISKLLLRGGRRVPVENADWRTMAAFREFQGKHGRQARCAQ